MCSVVSTPCNPMDCTPQGFSVHGIFQATILEWIDHFLLQWIFPTQGSNEHLLRLLLGRWILYHCTTWETQDNTCKRKATTVAWVSWNWYCSVYKCLLTKASQAQWKPCTHVSSRYQQAPSWEIPTPRGQCHRTETPTMAGTLKHVQENKEYSRFNKQRTMEGKQANCSQRESGCKTFERILFSTIIESNEIL